MAASYCSQTNLEAAKDRQLSCGTDTFMATGRLAHHEQVPPAPRGRIPKDATLKQRMAHKSDQARMGRLQPPQSHRRTRLRPDHDLPERPPAPPPRRGRRPREWRLLAACHNLRKIFRHAGTAGLTALTG